jgi:uncharacterized protein (TIGR02996 family)
MTEEADEDTRWCDRFAGDDAVLALRREVLEQSCKEVFEEIVAIDRKVASAIVSVSQYWADNADDEVHVHAFASHEAVCEWPHPCFDEDGSRPARSRSFCRACGRLPRLDWGYGELVPAFEAYCHERGYQEQSESQNGRPFAVIARGADGAIRVDAVGTLVRPWLDMPRAPAEPAPVDDIARQLLAAVATAPAEDGPRHVLADHWLERGDPRGEYMALVLHEGGERQRAMELRTAHHRSWMGSLAPFVPRGGVSFSRGLLTGVELFLDGVSVDDFDPDEASLMSVETLRFLPGSLVRVLPAMRHVRELGPLDDDALLDLLIQEVDFAVETLEIAPSSMGALDAIARADRLRKLRALRVVGPSASFARAPFLREAKLAGLAWIEVAFEADESAAQDAFAREVGAWGRTPPGPTLRVSQFDSDARRAAGFRVELSPDRTEARVVRTAPTSLTTREALEAAIRALPRTVRVVRGHGA